MYCAFEATGEVFKNEFSKTIGEDDGALYPDDVNDGGVDDNGAWSS